MVERGGIRCIRMIAGLMGLESQICWNMLMLIQTVSDGTWGVNSKNGTMKDLEDKYGITVAIIDLFYSILPW